MKRKVIIDTDPGIDDAFALMVAMNAKEFEILGITTVGGNVGIEQTTKNAASLVKLMGKQIFVFPGVDEPLAPLPDIDRASGVHGATGLGPVDLPEAETLISNVDAVTFIVEQTKKFPGEVEIITLGPVSNLALAVEKAPDTMQQVKAIWSMGGGIGVGNRTPVAEFNYWADPLAVQKILELDQVPIHMVGLNVTNSSLFLAEDMLFLQKECGERGKLLAKMLDFYFDSYWQRFTVFGSRIHDLVTVMLALDNKIAGENVIGPTALHIELNGFVRGMTIIDKDNHPAFANYPKNVTIYTGLDNKEYRQRFFDYLFPEKSDCYKVAMGGQR